MTGKINLQYYPTNHENRLVHENSDIESFTDKYSLRFLLPNYIQPLNHWLKSQIVVFTDLRHTNLAMIQEQVTKLPEEASYSQAIRNISWRCG